MNVIYACDENYVWLMGISMLSLFENNRERGEITVYLLSDHVSADSEEKLHTIARHYHRHLEVIDVNNLTLPESLYNERWPMSACSRLLACELLPGVERVLYLDCDIIVDGNIGELYDRPMGDNIVMAVKDCVSSAHKRKVGLHPDDVYINTGVLLMDLMKIAVFPMKERIEAFVQDYGNAIMYPDQDITNSIFRGRIGILPPEYNVMTQFNQYTYRQLRWIRHPSHYYSQKEIERAKRHAKIFHYTTCMLNVRPWFAASMLYNAHVFNRYLDMSPWRDRQKSEMAFVGGRYKMMRLLGLLPDGMMNLTLGLLHAYIKPYYMITRHMFKKLTGGGKCQAIVMAAAASERERRLAA